MNLYKNHHIYLLWPHWNRLTDSEASCVKSCVYVCVSTGIYLNPLLQIPYWVLFQKWTWKLQLHYEMSPLGLQKEWMWPRLTLPTARMYYTPIFMCISPCPLVINNTASSNSSILLCTHMFSTLKDILKINGSNFGPDNQTRTKQFIDLAPHLKR